MNARRRAPRLLAPTVVLGLDLAAIICAVHLVAALPTGVPVLLVLVLAALGLAGIAVLVLAGAGVLTPRHPVDGLGASTGILFAAALVAAAVNLYGPAGALALLLVAGDLRTSEARCSSGTAVRTWEGTRAGTVGALTIRGRTP
ncbi:hypothetical protein V6N00_12685 [Tersicoccus sp. MR15.9]|uniref:hypothetical protein n=1 Tax=Tersicoccus mangrovi TaxID=3121635 RepID=UPI002FE560C4